jgi:hypothetical protein
MPVAHVFADFGGATPVPNPHISGGGAATWTWMDYYDTRGTISPTVDLPAPTARYNCFEALILDLRTACIHLNPMGQRVVCGAFWAAYSGAADTPCAATLGDVPQSVVQTSTPGRILRAPTVRHQSRMVAPLHRRGQ